MVSSLLPSAMEGHAELVESLDYSQHRVLFYDASSKVYRVVSPYFIAPFCAQPSKEASFSAKVESKTSESSIKVFEIAESEVVVEQLPQEKLIHTILSRQGWLDEAYHGYNLKQLINLQLASMIVDDVTGETAVAFFVLLDALYHTPHVHRGDLSANADLFNVIENYLKEKGVSLDPLKAIKVIWSNPMFLHVPVTFFCEEINEPDAEELKFKRQLQLHAFNLRVHNNLLNQCKGLHERVLIRIQANAELLQSVYERSLTAGIGRRARKRRGLVVNPKSLVSSTQGEMLVLMQRRMDALQHVLSLYYRVVRRLSNDNVFKESRLNIRILWKQARTMENTISHLIATTHQDVIFLQRNCFYVPEGFLEVELTRLERIRKQGGDSALRIFKELGSYCSSGSSLDEVIDAKIARTKEVVQEQYDDIRRRETYLRSLGISEEGLLELRLDSQASYENYNQIALGLAESRVRGLWLFDQANDDLQVYFEAADKQKHWTLDVDILSGILEEEARKEEKVEESVGCYKDELCFEEEVLSDEESEALSVVVPESPTSADLRNKEVLEIFDRGNFTSVVGYSLTLGDRAAKVLTENLPPIDKPWMSKMMRDVIEEVRDHCYSAGCGIEVLHHVLTKNPNSSLLGSIVAMMAMDQHAIIEQTFNYHYLLRFGHLPQKHNLAEEANILGIAESLSKSSWAHLENHNGGLLWYRYLYASRQLFDQEGWVVPLPLMLMEALDKEGSVSVKMCSDVVEYMISAYRGGEAFLSERLETDVMGEELSTRKDSFVETLRDAAIKLDDGDVLTLFSPKQQRALANLMEVISKLDKHILASESIDESLVITLREIKSLSQRFVAALALFKSCPHQHLLPWHIRNILSCQWILEHYLVAQTKLAVGEDIHMHDFDAYDELLSWGPEMIALKRWNVKTHVHYPHTSAPLSKKHELLSVFRQELLRAPKYALVEKGWTMAGDKPAQKAYQKVVKLINQSISQLVPLLHKRIGDIL